MRSHRRSYRPICKTTPNIGVNPLGNWWWMRCRRMESASDCGVRFQNSSFRLNFDEGFVLRIDAIQIDGEEERATQFASSRRITVSRSIGFLSSGRPLPRILHDRLGTQSKSGVGRLGTISLRSREAAPRFRAALDARLIAVEHAADARSNRINAGDRPTPAGRCRRGIFR